MTSYLDEVRDSLHLPEACSAAAGLLHFRPATCIEWHDIGIRESFCKIILRIFRPQPQPVNLDGFQPRCAAPHRNLSMNGYALTLAPGKPTIAISVVIGPQRTPAGLPRLKQRVYYYW